MKALVKKRSGSLRHIVILLVAAFMVVFQSLTFLTSSLPISSAACWATPGWTSSSWGGSSGGRRRARWSAGTQGSSKFLAEIWTRLNCLHRSFLSIGQIFSLFLVLPLLLRSAFTFCCILYNVFYITPKVSKTARHDDRPARGLLNVDPSSPLLLRHEHQVHPGHRFLQPPCSSLVSTS